LPHVRCMIAHWSPHLHLAECAPYCSPAVTDKEISDRMSGELRFLDGVAHLGEAQCQSYTSSMIYTRSICIFPPCLLSCVCLSSQEVLLLMDTCSIRSQRALQLLQKHACLVMKDCGCCEITHLNLRFDGLPLHGQPLTRSPCGPCSLALFTGMFGIPKWLRTVLDSEKRVNTGGDTDE
jgi:hypothetical protein